MLSISHHTSRSSSLKNFLWASLLSTALTFTVEAVGSDGEKEDPEVIAQSTTLKLDRKARNALRERWIPYLTALTQKTTVPNWEELEKDTDPAQLNVFMKDEDTKLRLLQSLISPQNPKNTLYAVKLLSKYLNPIEMKMYFKGNLEHQYQEEFCKIWGTLQKIEDSDDRAMALHSLTEWLSYSYVDRIIFNSFDLLKSQYPWLSTFSVDVAALENKAVISSIAGFGMLEAYGLQGLKFTDHERNSKKNQGISGRQTVSYEDFLETNPGVPLDQESFMGILSIIEILNRGVTYLSFSKLWMNENQIDLLLNALTKFKKLRHLNLSSNPFGDIGAHHLSKLLQKLESLEHLNLNNCELTSKGISPLRKEFKRLPLYKLKISKNDLGVEGIKQLAEAFTGHPHLRILELNYQKIPTLAMDSFVPFLTSTPLNSLHLVMSKIKKKAFPQFVDALKASSSLQSLEMYGTPLDQGRFMTLAQGLKDTNIQYLNVGACGLNEEDIVALSEAIREGAPLQDLDISANEITFEAGDAFVDSLGGSDITNLRISGYRLDKETVLKLAEVIPQLPYLSDLELENAQLTDDGAVNLVKAAVQNPLFAHLSLNRNVFSDETHAFIARALDARQESSMSFAPLEIEYNEYAGPRSYNVNNGGWDEFGPYTNLRGSSDELENLNGETSSGSSDGTRSSGTPDVEENNEPLENDKEAWTEI